MRTLLAATILLTALGAAVPTADSCCMVPQDYPGDVDQSVQEVVVLFHDGHEELVLRVAPFFRDAEEAPKTLAWLVTVPSTPSAYETADPAIFGAARELHEKLEDLYEEQKPKPLVPTEMLGADGAVKGEWNEAQGLDIDETVTVGPYAITPVRTRGADAVGELNGYLGENGFATEDPDHLRWFAENDFTFLCIKITPPEGSLRLGKHLDLVPLRIGFKTDKPYYPGKYSANQGNFGLELTLLTTEPVARTSLSQVRSRLWASSGKGNLFTTKALPEAFAAAGKAALGSTTPSRWYLNRYDTHGFNRAGKDGKGQIHGWTEDVRWELGGDGDLPPSWYFGDGKRPIHHPSVLRWAFAALVAFLLFTGIYLFFIRKRRPPAEAA